MHSFDQGAAALIIQRLDSTVNEQLGMPNDFKDNCSTDGELDSANSNSSGEEHHEATTSGVNETCQLGKEGKKALVHSAYFLRRRHIIASCTLKYTDIYPLKFTRRLHIPPETSI